MLAPFAGAYDLLGVGYHGRPVEALSKHVSDQGSRCGMMTADPTVDIAQQTLPLFDGDAALQDPRVTSVTPSMLYCTVFAKTLHEHYTYV